jgi:hypothetical protein
MVWVRTVTFYSMVLMMDLRGEVHEALPDFWAIPGCGHTAGPGL